MSNFSIGLLVSTATLPVHILRVTGFKEMSLAHVFRGKVKGPLWQHMMPDTVLKAGIPAWWNALVLQRKGCDEGSLVDRLRRTRIQCQQLRAVTGDSGQYGVA